jgi:RNA polymerase sigma-70 factor (ECF subfamily)
MTQADFAAVALPHLDAAYNVARWLVRDAQMAEDVVQDAMLRAMTYFPGFRGENPRAWLLQIVRNTAISRLRGLRRLQEDALDDAHAELADPSADPEMKLVAVEEHSTLRAALAALPLELREVIVLREIEDLSYRDIARVVGVPTGTVMSRLFRARQMLLQLGMAARAKERV